MYEDDELQEEQSESTAGETVSNVEVVEEQRGLSSSDEIAASLEILEEKIEIEDPLGLFSSEDEMEMETTPGRLEEVSIVMRDISRVLMRRWPLHVVGDALETLLEASRNKNEFAAVLNELTRVFSPWTSEYYESFLPHVDDAFIIDRWEPTHSFSHAWFATWSRALSKTRQIEEEEPRTEAMRALAGSFEIWPWKSLSERSRMQHGSNIWFLSQAQEILGEVDRIESGFWQAKGLNALASFANTIRRSSLEPSYSLVRIVEFQRIKPGRGLIRDDRDTVLAIHDMNLRAGNLLGVDAKIDPEFVGTLPSEIIPPIDIEIPLEPTGPRYSDFIFYYDNNYSVGSRVPSSHPLIASRWYQLEVAVRVKPLGIPFKPTERFPDRRPTPEPKQTEPVTIWVTVQPDSPEDESIVIEEPVQTLTLPPVGDSSEHAYFRVRATNPSASPAGFSKLRVCLYYEFNLIEIALIEAEVIPTYIDPPQSRFSVPIPISFMQLALPREYVDFDNILPRTMNINIARRGDKYVFNFVFANAEDASVSFLAPISLQGSDLADALFNIRKLWYQIALSETFQKGLLGKEEEFIQSMRKLAQAGRRLWTGLFMRKTKGGRSAIYKVGQWLERHPIPPDSIVQVSFESDADNFVFPWSLLYDRPVSRNRDDPPDPNGFWGMRYCIEQQIPGRKYRTDEPIDVPDKMDFAFLLWEQFRNATEQKTLIANLRSRSSGKLEVSTPPISEPEKCYELLKNGKSHILYFYTHGHTRLRQADIGVGTNFQIFIDYYERLKKTDPLKKTLYYIYKSVKDDEFEPDRSWIGLTAGKVYLDEMEGEIPKFQSQPLVFLNMCESAQVTPSLSDSFIEFFLDRGAAGVIGTECPMTVDFAHPFAKEFLTDILTGESVGKALVDARRHFMNIKNPLGLAYTLFGSAAVRFTPPRF